VTQSEDAAWYACLNMIFSMSEIVYSKIESPGGSDNSQASTPRYSRLSDFRKTGCWKWFLNAATTFNELQFMDGSLNSVLTCSVPNAFPPLNFNLARYVQNSLVKFQSRSCSKFACYIPMSLVKFKIHV